ncbi:glycosyltransferase family 2 protein [Sinorhizobium americanum]|uniref:Succinoglycan biosynthesis protein ExoM n=1 Tax=Sinorhizobium americanum TaxID=194963 RepID=A0A1L3LY44_9HYPH|nr:glycosyltransferase family 2 protein [Sinorhizobium americanum]APG94971.1 succinoglycan biosynthesis protein ExoM [Sinorhizobium americanum]OAP37141.1 glycosyl transferase family A [Sinorhizobium americanum]
MSAPLQIDIGVCTFRRPELAATLRSLAAVTVPARASLRVIVADNDSTPSARALVEKLRPEMPFEVTYLHCPASNISIARNACLDNSTGDLLAFIDDDETASSDWLVSLLEEAQASGADAVLGPVRAHYAPAAPAWMRRGDFHSTLPVWVKGEIRTGYTCNALLRIRAPSLHGRRFKLALGRSGGEDTDFFTGMHQAGGTIAFAADAWVHEPVPVSRASFAWLAKRRFRSGQTHGRLLAEKARGAGQPLNLALAASKAAFCACAAALFLPLVIRRNRYALRAVLHAGVISGLLGHKELEQYGAAEVTSR